MDIKKIHGNSAKVPQGTRITPMFGNYVVNDYKAGQNAVYNRLEDDAEFCKREVDANKK